MSSPPQVIISVTTGSDEEACCAAAVAASCPGLTQDAYAKSEIKKVGAKARKRAVRILVVFIFLLFWFSSIWGFFSSFFETDNL